MRRRISIALFTGLALLLFASLSASALEIIGDVEAGLNAQNQFYLHFETDGPATSQVTYNGHTTPEFISLDGLHTHVLTHAEPGTTYEYSIRLTDWFGGEATVTGTVTTPPLSSPNNIVVATSNETAVLRWQATFGAAEYIVERADSANGPFSEIGKTQETSFVDKSVENNAEYHYRVIAVSGSGDKAEPSRVISVVIVPALVDDEFFEIDLNTWEIWGTNPNAIVEAVDGQLRFRNFNVGAGWDNNQRGLVLREPIDLTGKITTITVRYIETGYNEQNVAFAGAIHHGSDIWNHNGFRLTVGPSGFSSTSMSGADGSFSGISANNIAKPYTLTWVIKDEGGRFVSEALVNGSSVGTATISMGSLNPSKLYFYLYASNDGNPGPTVIDSIKIEQEPVF